MAWFRPQRSPPFSRFKVSGASSSGPSIGHGSRKACTLARLEQVLSRSRREGDEVMARTVAVKLVDPASAATPRRMQELRRSVRRTALVSHANVVQVTD